MIASSIWPCPNNKMLGFGTGDEGPVELCAVGCVLGRGLLGGMTGSGG